MRDLSVQAANASSSASDRASINNEIQQLSAEIQRVATSTSFNGTNLLDGSFAAQTFQVGANQGQTITVNSIASMQTSQLGSAGTSFSANVTGGTVTSALATGGLTLNGFSVGPSQLGSLPGQSASSAYSIANAINAVSGNTGVTAAAATTTTTGTIPGASNSIAANSFSINGINVGAVAAGGTAVGQGANVAAAINAISGQSGVTATADSSGKVTLTAIDGRNINVTANNGTFNGVAASISQANLTSWTGLGGTAATTLMTDTTYGTAASTFAAVSSLTVNGITVSGAQGTSALTEAQNFVSAFNTEAAKTSNAGTLGGITASNDANGIVSISSNGTQVNMSISAAASIAITSATYVAQHGTVSLNSTNSAGIVLSGGQAANAGFVAGTTGAAVVSSVNSIAGVSTTTATNATNAIATIDGALAIVNNAQPRWVRTRTVSLRRLPTCKPPY
jgi:flagellin